MKQPIVNFEIDVVKIVDDDEETATQCREIILDLGFESEIITGHYTSVDALAEHLLKDGPNIALLCDHRLQPGALASFYGSELVARMYDSQVPSVLMTQFSHTDNDTSIRRFRRWMPSLIPRTDMNKWSVSKGFNTCSAELQGVSIPERIPHRTLIEIIGQVKEGEYHLAEAFVPGWDSNVAVRFPISLISDGNLQRHLLEQLSKTGVALAFAEVNVGASDYEELFFQNFEFADSADDLVLPFAQ